MNEPKHPESNLTWHKRWRLHALFLFVVVALSSLAWTGTTPVNDTQKGHSENEVTPMEVTGLAVTKELMTPESPEELAAHTDGIVMMGGLIVLLIVVGTLATIRRKKV
jgi:hypothetical protein